MVAQEKLVEFVSRLVEMTQVGKIRWTLGNRMPLAVIAPNLPVFVGTYEVDRLRIYVKSIPRNLAAKQAATLADLQITTSDLNSYMHVQRVTLELIDAQERCIYEFPPIQGLTDLYEVIRSRAADVEGFINKILSDR